MRIASINEVIRGKILNLYIVTSIKKIVFDARKVARGDLLFLEDIDDLDLAIKNGAYAVVFDKDLMVQNSEIAFIKVADLHTAYIRVLRFLIAEKEPAVFVADSVTIDLANSYIKNSRLLATDDPKKAISMLQASEMTPILLLENSLKEAQINSVELTEKKLTIIRSTIYNMTLKNPKITLQIPALFIKQLSFIYALSDLYNLKIELHSKDVPLSRYRCVRYGEKILIFDNASDPSEALEFIQAVAPWAKIYLPQSDDIDLMAKEIRSSYFQYAYLNNHNIDLMLEKITKSEDLSLFLFKGETV